MTEAFSKDFVCSADHLPIVLQAIYKPAYLENDFPELLSIAESFINDKVTPQMVHYLTQLTHGLAVSQLLDLNRFFTLILTNLYYPFLKLFVI